MSEPEPAVHSFIVRLWLEDSGQAGTRVQWHGYITHLPGGEKKYLKSLDEIADFIAPYLGQQSVKAEHGPRKWLNSILKKMNAQLI